MPRNPEVTRKIMSAIRSTDTRPEMLLRKALWRKGLRLPKKMALGGETATTGKFTLATQEKPHQKNDKPFYGLGCRALPTKQKTGA